MRFCEVSHSELAIFFEARIAELRQLFLPVPNLISLIGVASSFVVQANLNNAVNVAQTFLQLKIGVSV